MSEYIVDVGDADKLHFSVFQKRAGFCFGYPVREEIVRCRDCKHLYEESRCTSVGLVDVLMCESEQWSTSSLMPSHEVKPGGFCKWGERRSE